MALQMPLLKMLHEKSHSLNMIDCTCLFRIYLKDRSRKDLLLHPAKWIFICWAGVDVLFVLQQKLLYSKCVGLGLRHCCWYVHQTKILFFKMYILYYSNYKTACVQSQKMSINALMELNKQGLNITCHVQTPVGSYNSFRSFQWIGTSWA